jgi:hypothetical protein
MTHHGAFPVDVISRNYAGKPLQTQPQSGGNWSAGQGMQECSLCLTIPATGFGQRLVIHATTSFRKMGV